MRKVFAQDLVGQVATVAFLHLRIVDGGDVAEVADLVRNHLARFQVILEAIVATFDGRGGSAQCAAAGYAGLQFAEEDVARLKVHVHQVVGVNVLEAASDVREQCTQLGFVEEAARLEYILKAAAVAVFILNEHVIVLRPGRVVSDNVVVFAENRMGPYFVEGGFSVKWEYNSYLFC